MFSVGVRVSFTSDKYIFQENATMGCVEVILSRLTAQDVVVFVEGGTV